MKVEEPSGPTNRLPCKKSHKHRGHLTAIGVFQEVHCDGHEKLAADG